jgi:hypothetical protein
MAAGRALGKSAQASNALKRRRNRGERTGMVE